VIEFLDPANRSDVDDVAALYEKHLADSPVVLLGPWFLREFYYSTLVADGLVGVLFYRVNGRVAAFLSYTRNPGGFIGEGARRHPLRLGWTMLKSVVLQPRLIGSILTAVGYVSRRRGDSSRLFGDGLAEALSLVVPPEYQRLVPPGRKSRLTVRLVEELAEHLAKDGVTRVLYPVEPRNTSSCLLFSSLGCEMEKSEYAGKTVYLYTHRLGDGQE
jgi:ribosomal protein S18 acetylase RimI-like enzyme